jgi:hypothetical protein
MLSCAEDHDDDGVVGRGGHARHLGDRRQRFHRDRADPRLAGRDAEDLGGDRGDAPLSCSRSTLMTCASLNRLFLIVRLLMTDSHINRGSPRGAGHTIAVALWVWHEIRGVAIGWHNVCLAYKLLKIFERSPSTEPLPSEMLRMVVIHGKPKRVSNSSRTGRRGRLIRQILLTHKDWDKPAATTARRRSSPSGWCRTYSSTLAGATDLSWQKRT